MEAYYVRLGKRIIGPVSEAELRRMAASGQISDLHLVSRNRIDWAPAKQLKGLFINANVPFSTSPPQGEQPSGDRKLGKGAVSRGAPPSRRLDRPDVSRDSRPFANPPPVLNLMGEPLPSGAIEVNASSYGDEETAYGMASGHKPKSFLKSTWAIIVAIVVAIMGILSNKSVQRMIGIGAGYVKYTRDQKNKEKEKERLERIMKANKERSERIWKETLERYYGNK
jgi:hypothetical protein